MVEATLEGKGFLEFANQHSEWGGSGANQGLDTEKGLTCRAVSPVLASAQQRDAACEI